MFVRAVVPACLLIYIVIILILLKIEINQKEAADNGAHAGLACPCFPVHAVRTHAVLTHAVLSMLCHCPVVAAVAQMVRC